MIELNNYYNKKLKSFARQNRNDATKSEACLWKYVLRSKQTGYAFNRQRPVLNYIADFMCMELKLIIEVDGYTHTFDEVKKNDLIRQTRLEKAGFMVLRFKDEEVLMEIGRVREVILETIDERITFLSRPADTLSMLLR
jgi:very-short-patch-repair endonuclease